MLAVIRGVQMLTGDAARPVIDVFNCSRLPGAGGEPSRGGWGKTSPVMRGEWGESGPEVILRVQGKYPSHPPP